VGPVYGLRSVWLGASERLGYLVSPPLRSGFRYFSELIPKKCVVNVEASRADV